MAQPDDVLTLLAARLYDTAFDRHADADGAAAWAGVLASGASLRSVADRFFASAEFAARHAGQDDEAFIRSLYRDALEREPRRHRRRIGGFKILPETAYDVLGASVSAAGDANGDGLDDLLVGSWASVGTGNAPGATYLIYGSSSWAT